MELDHLAAQINLAATTVHKELGPGLLEKIYCSCMAFELSEMGLNARTDVPLPIRYRKKIIQGEGLKIDLLVEEMILVSLKSSEMIRDIYKKQLLTALRLAEKPLGLLINFQETVQITSFSGNFLLRPKKDLSFLPLKKTTRNANGIRANRSALRSLTGPPPAL